MHGARLLSGSKSVMIRKLTIEAGLELNIAHLEISLWIVVALGGTSTMEGITMRRGMVTRA